MRGEPPGPGTVLLGSTQTPSAGTKPVRPAGREQQRPPRQGVTFSCEETRQQSLRCTENEPRVLFPCPAWGGSCWARGLPLPPVSAGHAAALPRATGVRPFRQARSGDEDRRDGACANTREATGGSFTYAEGAHGRRAKAPASSEKARQPSPGKEKGTKLPLTASGFCSRTQCLRRCRARPSRCSRRSWPGARTSSAGASAT